VVNASERRRHPFLKLLIAGVQHAQHFVLLNEGVKNVTRGLRPGPIHHNAQDAGPQRDRMPHAQSHLLLPSAWDDRGRFDAIILYISVYRKDLMVHIPRGGDGL
jgi:hypothetical protein